MCRSSIKIEWLIHVILWCMVYGTAPANIGPRPVSGIGWYRHESALDEQGGDPLFYKTIVIAADKHNLLRDGIGTDL